MPTPLPGERSHLFVDYMLSLKGMQGSVSIRLHSVTSMFAGSWLYVMHMLLSGRCTRLYPGLLGIAATAHMAAGFKERRPATIKTGMAILKALPQSCEVLVMRAVGSVLLGDPEAAANLIKSAQR